MYNDGGGDPVETNHAVVFAENLNAIMRRRGVSQADISKAFGFPKTTVSSWCTGDKMPRMDKIEILADFFGVLKSDLIESKGRPKGVKIPVLGRVQAGMPVEAVEEILDYEEITQELAATGDFFALQIRGDSMEPKFSEGDVVIVRKQEDADTNDIIVALVNGDEATVKQLKKFEDGSIALVSTNPAYKPFYFSRDEIATLPVVVLGRVVELRAKF